MLVNGCYLIFLDVVDNMKYEEFVEQVNKYYYTKEPIYFKAIADLEELRKDLIKLDETQHLIGIVKPTTLATTVRIIPAAIPRKNSKSPLPLSLFSHTAVTFLGLSISMLDVELLVVESSTQCKKWF